MRKITINTSGDTYKIENSDLSNFEMLGLFEQIVFDLKRARAEKKSSEAIESQIKTDSKLITVNDHSAESASDQRAEIEKTEPPKNALSERISGVTSSTATDLRTRIGNAEKAIRDLGGKLNTTDPSKMSDEELQSELEELTTQYKRLKKSKGAGK